ncbi:Laminin subunit alpha-2 [Araneus ventricosus]|uniref:Laminin subunit alpha-2 n=1 Tax=Araneus ventricosus TaxID=182803 RepID=A0A4Y2FP79_ARAVE|nr:Laminin subunit alpha-2 [Araneus ventricosus]
MTSYYSLFTLFHCARWRQLVYPEVDKNFDSNANRYKIGALPFLECECYGHSDQCHYEQVVADKRLSINTHGKYEGGGVCDNCKHHTSGINCEQCEDGYYRPSKVARNHTKPCRKCQCSGPGMTGLCVKDDAHLLEGLVRSLIHYM